MTSVTSLLVQPREGLGPGHSRGKALGGSKGDPSEFLVLLEGVFGWMWRVRIGPFRTWTPWTWPGLVAEKRGLVPETVNSEQSPEAGAHNSSLASSSVHLLPRGAGREQGGQRTVAPGETAMGTWLVGPSPTHPSNLESLAFGLAV